MISNTDTKLDPDRGNGMEMIDKGYQRMNISFLCPLKLKSLCFYHFLAVLPDTLQIFAHCSPTMFSEFLLQHSQVQK